MPHTTLTLVFYINWHGWTKSAALCVITEWSCIAVTFGVWNFEQHIFLRKKWTSFQRDDKFRRWKNSVQFRIYFNIYFVYFSTPNMDMFATSFFWSPFPDPHAWWSNYLIVHWIGMFVYEFPPPIFLFLAPFSQRWSWFLDQL